jgi:hypothetical protein
MRRIDFVLILIWLFGLVWCVAPLLYFWDYIPHFRLPLFGKAVSCLGPQLAAMLAFTFSKEVRATQRKSAKGQAAQQTTQQGPIPPVHRVQHGVAILAIILSGLYVGTFVVLFGAFAFHRTTASDLIQQVDVVQPAISFLVTGMLAYYFGKR